MLQLYFIRHGQSTNNIIPYEKNEDYLFERSTDPDLTALGIEQARLIAETLAQPYRPDGVDPQNRAGFGLTHLYCSLMIRAVKTASAIAEKTHLPLVAWPELHETGGLFDTELIDGEPVLVGQPGHGRSYFATHFPRLVLPEDLPESGWYNREKEPRESYAIRARAIFDRIMVEHSGTDHRVGLVMHGGIFARIISAIFNLQAENYWLLMNNCAVSRVDVRPDGRITLVYLNKVDHLPDHLIT